MVFEKFNLTIFDFSWLIAADYLEENGEFLMACAIRKKIYRLSPINLFGHNWGCGEADGNGDGYGSGSGSGYSSGFSNDNGYGDGSGGILSNGSGNGDGSGWGCGIRYNNGVS